MEKFARLIKSDINETGWRSNTYERSDGTIFHVSIPISYNSKTGERSYNEIAEAQMLLSMYGCGEKHIHVAGDGDAIDTCKKCGLDIRNEIHLRNS
jgi:hypothetical protein